MHGIIFTELRKYVDEKLGGDAWSNLLSAAGLSGRMYLPIQEYPDAEAVTLVTTAARITGLDPALILESFGEFIAPSLLGMYRTLVKEEWKTLDVVEFTEDTIHKVVRQRNPGAKPPELKAVRLSPTQLKLTYGSQRKLCFVAKGIMKGLANHFGEEVTVEETQCMHSGAELCEMVVSVAAEVGIPKDELNGVPRQDPRTIAAVPAAAAKPNKAKVAAGAGAPAAAKQVLKMDLKIARASADSPKKKANAAAKAAAGNPSPSKPKVSAARKPGPQSARAATAKKTAATPKAEAKRTSVVTQPKATRETANSKQRVLQGKASKKTGPKPVVAATVAPKTGRKAAPKSASLAKPAGKAAPKAASKAAKKPARKVAGERSSARQVEDGAKVAKPGAKGSASMPTPKKPAAAEPKPRSPAKIAAKPKKAQKATGRKAALSAPKLVVSDPALKAGSGGGRKPLKKAS